MLASRIRVRLRIPTGLVVVAVLASAPARGQVAAPSMVDEDLPQEEAPPQARKDRPPVRAGEPVPEPPPQAETAKWLDGMTNAFIDQTGRLSWR